MSPKLAVALPAIFLMLVTGPAFAGPLTIDGGVVFVGANGQDVDPSNSVTTGTGVYYPAAWNTSFSVGISEGRSSTDGDYGFKATTNGLQFDAYNVDTTINAGGPSYNPSAVVDDRASAQVQLTFTLSQAAQYSISGGYSGFGTAGTNNLGGGILAALSNLDTSTTLYLESKNTGGSDAASFQLGDSNPGTLIGARSGTLGPGQYRFVWETTTVDLFSSGGGLSTNGSANVVFQLGSFANAPEPDAMLIFGLGLLGLAFRRQSWAASQSNEEHKYHLDDY